MTQEYRRGTNLKRSMYSHTHKHTRTRVICVGNVNFFFFLVSFVFAFIFFAFVIRFLNEQASERAESSSVCETCVIFLIDMPFFSYSFSLFVPPQLASCLISFHLFLYRWHYDVQQQIQWALTWLKEFIWHNWLCLVSCSLYPNFWSIYDSVAWTWKLKNKNIAIKSTTSKVEIAMLIFRFWFDSSTCTSQKKSDAVWTHQRNHHWNDKEDDCPLLKTGTIRV